MQVAARASLPPAPNAERFLLGMAVGGLPVTGRFPFAIPSRLRHPAACN